MKLSDNLRYLADFPSHAPIAPILQSAADKLDDSHLWREAWMRAEKRVEELTSEVERLRYRLPPRKEKECED
jgi:hypothetical protein